MFERFTDRARKVVVLAQEEARMLNHNYIGTEHILLGLIHEGEGVAAKALESLGISLELVRVQVEEIIGQGQEAPSGHIPFTPRAKKVLELSLREALQLGHNYIGTEHIQLGLIREGEGVAAQVLVRLGADLNRVRQQAIQLLHGYQAGRSQETEPGAARSEPAEEPAEARRRERQAAALAGRIKAIEARLSAIELRLGPGPDLHDVDELIGVAADGKREAVDAERYERAAALRDQERRLQADRNTLIRDWDLAHPSLVALAEEVSRLQAEVARLTARGTEAAEDAALDEFDDTVAAEASEPPADQPPAGQTPDDEAPGDNPPGGAPPEDGPAEGDATPA